MKRITFIITLTVLPILLGCNPKSNTKGEKEIIVAQWGQEKYLIYLPLYIAMDNGFFKEEGLNVKLKYSGNDDQVFATVIKGDADFGVGDPIFTAISRERGFSGKVVATIVNGVSIWGVTNNEKLQPITRISDLNGLRIGTFPEPSTNYTLMKRTIQENPELKDAKIIQAPIGSQLALLENGEADIAMELEPSTSLAISKGYRLVFSSPNFYGQLAFTGLTTTESYISKNQDVVQSFVNALEKAVQFCHNNQEKTIAVAAKIFPNIDQNVIKMAVMRMLNEKTLPEHIITSDIAWKNAIDVRVIVGDIKKPEEAIKSVDNRFAEKAIKSN
ncbi:MAG: ABC transporter substrate-binding protein [Bacteroidales bacterium]|nr:ABC transporter substrate-binding protein [Bacteroidales bacterium]